MVMVTVKKKILVVKLYTSGSQASGMAVPGVSSLVIDCSGARKGGVK